MIGYIVAGAAALSSAPAQAPLGSPGSWTLIPGISECTAQRTFGAKAKMITLGVQLKPPVHKGTLTLLLPASLRVKRLGEALIASGSSERPLKAEFYSERDAPKGFTSVSISVSNRDLNRLFTAPAITISGIGRDVMAFAVGGSKQTLSELDACWDRLLSGWGIDRAQVAAVDRPAVGNEGAWVTHFDYPAVAKARRESGTSVILWKIDRQGSVSGCTVIESSGSPSLDAAACKAIMKRAHYDRPAIDSAGKPVQSWGRRTIRWLVP